MKEKGLFSINQEGTLHHDSYFYQRSILGSKKTENLLYDHNLKVANYKSKKKERQVTLDADYLNTLTYQVKLRQDLINQSDKLNYQVIHRGKLKNYRFRASGHELLETPIGLVKALRVDRIREDSKRETALWFAPQMDYLLVKLWQREKDGEEYEISLKEGSLNGLNLASLINDTKLSDVSSSNSSPLNKETNND